jgi:hypothetical protein
MVKQNKIETQRAALRAYIATEAAERLRQAAFAADMSAALIVTMALQEYLGARGWWPAPETLPDLPEGDHIEVRTQGRSATKQAFLQLTVDAHLKHVAALYAYTQERISLALLVRRALDEWLAKTVDSPTD